MTDDRDRRRSASAGSLVSEPPAQMPVLPRTISPDRLDAFEKQLRALTSATAELWGSRDVDKRLSEMRKELGDNTRSTIRMEAVVDEMVLPLIKEQLAKLDTCMHHIAASSGTALALDKLALRFDAQDKRIEAIATEQALAAERFAAHDERDRQIETVARDTQSRVVEIEQRLAIADNTAKVRRLVARPRWWRAKWVAAIGVAVAGAITAATAAYLGGCT